MDGAISEDTWDADCEAAFTLALPPKWEFRDRAWGTSCVWRPMPDSVSTEINALANRGQRRGNVTIDGQPFLVDLQDSVAVPTESRAIPRMLRKCTRTPQVNKRALRSLYCKYVEELPPADHPSGPDGIGGEKVLLFFQDLEIDPSTDVAALAFCEACAASEMGVFRRREFIRGCATLEVDTIEDLRRKMVELRQDVLGGRLLPQVYRYTFGVALESHSKVLPLEEAAQYWALLLHQWPLRKDFCDWAQEHMRGKMINRDLWMMVFKLATEVPPDLSTYDEDPAWPVVIDEFVEYYRAKKG